MSDDRGVAGPQGQKDKAMEGEGNESSLYNSHHPRVYLWKETISVLKDAGVPSTAAEVTEYCNEALQFAIRSGQAASPNMTDVVAALTALNSRCRELAVLQLELLSVTQDTSLLVEQLTLAGPVLEEICRAQAKTREANLAGKV